LRSREQPTNQLIDNPYYNPAVFIPPTVFYTFNPQVGTYTLGPIAQPFPQMQPIQQQQPNSVEQNIVQQSPSASPSPSNNVQAQPRGFNVAAPITSGKSSVTLPPKAPSANATTVSKPAAEQSKEQGSKDAETQRPPRARSEKPKGRGRPTYEKVTRNPETGVKESPAKEALAKETPVKQYKPAESPKPVEKSQKPVGEQKPQQQRAPNAERGNKKRDTNGKPHQDTRNERPEGANPERKPREDKRNQTREVKDTAANNTGSPKPRINLPTSANTNTDSPADQARWPRGQQPAREFKPRGQAKDTTNNNVNMNNTNNPVPPKTFEPKPKKAGPVYKVKSDTPAAQPANKQ
jgi:hypothetical protein